MKINIVLNGTLVEEAPHTKTALWEVLLFAIPVSVLQ